PRESLLAPSKEAVDAPPPRPDRRRCPRVDALRRAPAQCPASARPDPGEPDPDEPGPGERGHGRHGSDEPGTPAGDNAGAARDGRSAARLEVLAALRRRRRARP